MATVIENGKLLNEPKQPYLKSESVQFLTL